MKNVLTNLLIGLLVITGLSLLILTNTGILSLRKPYVVQKSAEMPPPPEVVAFTHVNVVPMEDEYILADQTVLVRDGIIAEIGPAVDIALPEGTLAIDGTGKYLMPGLIDSHVHIKEENELVLFLAHGVTAVRDMWGTTGMQLRLGFADQLDMRQKINQGELIGPTIYTAGPLIEGKPATSPLMPVIDTPEQAAESITWQAAQGYDFVKVYDHLNPETYEAALATAAAEGLPVVGHVPFAVGIDRVLAGGQQTIEHLSGYIDSDSAEFIIPEEALDRYAAQTREASVWNCPTLGVYTKVVPANEQDQLQQMPGMEFVSPRMRFLWSMFLNQLRGGLIYTGDDYPARITALNMKMTRALHEAGAGIILGTDSDNPFLIPGLSLLDELDYLTAAGFTPYEALISGTRDAARVLGQGDVFGTIVPGKRADLLLLAANPLEDVRHVRQQVGVFAGGRWWPEEELQGMLAELAASYEPTLLDRLWPLLLPAAAVVLVIKKWF